MGPFSGVNLPRSLIALLAVAGGCFTLLAARARGYNRRNQSKSIRRLGWLLAAFGVGFGLTVPLSLCGREDTAYLLFKLLVCGAVVADGVFQLLRQRLLSEQTAGRTQFAGWLLLLVAALLVIVFVLPQNSNNTASGRQGMNSSPRVGATVSVVPASLPERLPPEAAYCSRKVWPGLQLTGADAGRLAVLPCRASAGKATGRCDQVCLEPRWQLGGSLV